MVRVVEQMTDERILATLSQELSWSRFNEYAREIAAQPSCRHRGSVMSDFDALFELIGPIAERMQDL